MQIKNGWTFKDPLTKLTLTVIKGTDADRLRIESETLICDYRFTKDGEFDGTAGYVPDTTDAV